jgi:hypothetical protein
LRAADGAGTRKSIGGSRRTNQIQFPFFDDDDAEQ